MDVNYGGCNKVGQNTTRAGNASHGLFSFVLDPMDHLVLGSSCRNISHAYRATRTATP